jgi:hypothetical protein
MKSLLMAMVLSCTVLSSNLMADPACAGKRSNGGDCITIQGKQGTCENIGKTAIDYCGPNDCECNENLN